MAHRYHHNQYEGTNQVRYLCAIEDWQGMPDNLSMIASKLNPIEAAVLPQKQDAIARAEKEARDIIRGVREELAKAGNNLHKAAPYPSGMLPLIEHHVAMERYHIFSLLTEWRPNQIVGMHGPCFADVTAKQCKKFVGRARQDAALQYDRFILKLTKKIGPVLSAFLEGNHVWSYSFLYVTKRGAKKECWKTQTIVNHSKFGHPFLQFPSRKVKTK